MILQVEPTDVLPSRIYRECHMTTVDQAPVAGSAAVVFSACCPEKPTPNEDSAAVLPFDDVSGILVVADGMGGGRMGGQASAMSIAALRLALQEARQSGESLRSAILNGIEDANQLVQSLGIGAATTLVVLEIQEKTVRPYHVGDSMILVVGQRGKCKLQTICHSPVGFAVEAGVLDPTAAMHHEDRHLVSNMIGTPTMRIEIGSRLKLAPRDTVLLASDGLFDNLHLPEIIERIRKGPLDQAVDALAIDARQRMHTAVEGTPSKPDDLTIVGWRPPALRRARRVTAEPASQAAAVNDTQPESTIV